MPRCVRQRAQAGVGLLEVAVALLVLCIAFLGLARGQLVAREVARQAAQRSEALRLASALLEVVQANPDVSAYAFGGLSGLTRPGRDCAGQVCDASELAAWDLWSWRTQVEGAAARDAGGRGIAGLVDPAACLSLSGGEARLTLSWRETPGGESSTCGDTAPTAGVSVLSLAAWSRGAGS